MEASFNHAKELQLQSKELKTKHITLELQLQSK